MAEFNSAWGYSGEPAVTATLGAAASTAEIVLGPQAIFLITCAGDFHVVFGNANMAAATVAAFQYPANSVQTLQTGDHTDRIRVFSTAGGVYWIQKLDRF
jgi:hypothetical protein